MPSDSSHVRRERNPWTYALVGGLATIPLVIGSDLLADVGNTFPINMVVLGGFVAGFLAGRASADPHRAAAGAGLLGATPGLVWLLPALVDTATDFATAWAFPPATAVFIALFGTVIVCLTAFLALLGGVVGNWLAGKIDGWRSVTTAP